MKIGFDGRYAEDSLVGIGKYIKNIIEGLSSKGIKCIIFYSKKPKYRISGKNIKSIIVGTRDKYLFEQVLIPLYLVGHNVDLYHVTGNIGAPFFSPVPVLVTIHDIIPFEDQTYFKNSRFPFVSRFSYVLRLKIACYRASKIITLTKYIRNKVVKKLYVPKNKIIVVKSGIDSIKSTKKLPHGLTKGKYILNHGGIDPRKNLENNILAYKLLREKNLDLKLVITGENILEIQKLKFLVSKLKLELDVLFTGYVSDTTLSSLIRNASCICYLSLNEGFGSPVLEGYRSGIPVVTSVNGALRETAGDGALFVNPQNIHQIANTLNTVTKNNFLRKKLINKGYLISKLYSWENTVKKMIEIISKYENRNGRHFYIK